MPNASTNPAAPASLPNAKHLRDLIITALEDTKAEDIQTLDVTSLTDVTDFMVICSGSSDRHVQAVARNMSNTLAEKGVKPIGLEGEEQKDWILIDYVDVVVHVMKRETREYYDLESLWNADMFKQTRQEEA